MNEERTWSLVFGIWRAHNGHRKNKARRGREGSTPLNDSGSANIRTKISIALVALALIVLQLFSQQLGLKIRVDAVTLGLLILALLPWLPPWIERLRVGDVFELR